MSIRTSFQKRGDTAIKDLHRCIHELVQDQAQRTPESIAAVADNQLLTYRELDQRSNQLAAYLRKQGVGPEVPVGVCLKRSMDLVIALLAVLKAGGACVPLDPGYPLERLEFMLKDTRAPLLLTHEGLLPTSVTRHCRSVLLPHTWGLIAEERTAGFNAGVTSNNLAHIIYTSGSTGTPRGVMLTHEGLVNHHLAVQHLYDLRASDRVLQFSSISFDIALEEIFPTWIAGATLVLRTDRVLAAREFVQWIDKQKITVLDLPTAYWHELVHQLWDLQQPLPATMRLVIVGGEKPSPKALNSWNSLVKGRIRWINTYGPSETSIIATAYEPSSDRVWAPEDNIPIGRPIPNTELHVLGTDLKPVSEGAAGELHIGGAGLARGYLNQQQRTAEKFIQHPVSKIPGDRLYKTGDMVRYLPDGEIEFLGRMDDQVKIRGFRVELGEIEAALASYSAVQESVVIVTGSEANKQLVAYIVCQPNCRPTEAEIKTFLGRRLPEYMVPANVITLEKLPLTPNGKVDKKGLPAPSLSPANRSGERRGPEDPYVLQITQIWEKVLAKAPIGPHQNFFELGGHSLLAVRLMHALERQLAVQLPITALVEAPTIAKLAEVSKAQVANWNSLVGLQTHGEKPPFFCVHGIGGTVLRFRDLAARLGPDQPFYGLQVHGLDGKQTVHTTVEDMATHYIKEMRRVQAEGPYYLGGYSFGGLVALEMAMRLKHAGEEVGLVVLLDTFPGALRSNASLFRTYLNLPLEQKFQHLARKTKALPRSVRRRVAMMRLPENLTKVRQACYMAASSYQMKLYQGPALLFRASEKGLSAANQEKMWNQFVPDLGIIEVDGHHGNIIEPPQVQFLAERLKAHLEAAYQQRNAAIVAGSGFITQHSSTSLEIA